MGSTQRVPRPKHSNLVFTGSKAGDFRIFREKPMEDDSDSDSDSASHMSISSDSGEIDETTSGVAINTASDDDNYAQLPHHQASGPLTEYATSLPTPFGAAPAAAMTGTRLSELPPADQDLQTRYFGISQPYEIVRCVTCDEVGHTGTSCPELTCKHCGVFNHHTSSACPKYRKCRRCRQRGHDDHRPPCTRPRVEPGKPGDACDVCGQLGHPEETCKALWSISKPDPKTIHQIDVSELKVSCYNCASDQHFGDDCPTLPGFLRGKRTVWNAEFASHFTKDSEGGVSLSGYERTSARPNTTAQSWQMSAFDDMRD